MMIVPCGLSAEFLNVTAGGTNSYNLGIDEMVFDLSSEVLKGYSLFLIHKTNIFVKLLKLNLMPM